MKIKDYCKIVFCCIITFIFIYLLSTDFIFSLGLAVASGFPWYWIRKAIIKHDLNAELNLIDEHYNKH